MAHSYKAVGWNRQKRIYDATLLGSVLAVLATFIGVSLTINPHSTAETLIIRGTALCAALLLHVILVIGPLARLNPTFLPLLYNRRHLGVTMFLLAFTHAAFTIVQFHALGPVNPLVSIFTAYKTAYASGRAGQFPFEPFGFAALVILFFMAATSHDFWLKNLGASTWKTLHIGVYVAYGSLLVHVGFGVLQSETSPMYVALLAAGFSVVMGLHLAAGIKEARVDKQREQTHAEGYLPACKVDALENGHGKAVMIAGQRRAVFRHGDRIYALSNVCRHQGGPIGEGRILDGCITCPWHGWQYKPDDGVSPPPFHEVLETYPVRVVDGMIYVNPQPHPLEARTEGAAIGAEA